MSFSVSSHVELYQEVEADIGVEVLIRQKGHLPETGQAL